MFFSLMRKYISLIKTNVPGNWPLTKSRTSSLYQSFQKARVAKHELTTENIPTRTWSKTDGFLVCTNLILSFILLYPLIIGNLLFYQKKCDKQIILLLKFITNIKEVIFHKFYLKLFTNILLDKFYYKDW